MIIYIGGYGRSGSTILDIALSNKGNIISLGELSNIFEKRFADLLPPVYDELIENLSNQYDLDKVAILNKATSTLKPHKKPKSNIATYTVVWRALFDHLEIKYPNSIFVDSSKTSYNGFLRPFYLSRKVKQEIVFVHLIRKFPSVRKSFLKGSNVSHSDELRAPKRGKTIRVAFSWFGVNLLTALVYKRVFGDKYIQIDFEDFQNNQDHTCNRILEKCASLKNIETLGNELSLKNCIAFSGNRTFRSDKIVLRNADSESSINTDNDKGFALKYDLLLRKLIGS